MREMFKRLLAHIRGNWFCVYRFFRFGEIWQIVTLDHIQLGRTHISVWCPEDSRLTVLWKHPDWDSLDHDD